MNYRGAQMGEDMSVQPSPKPLILLVEDNPIQSRISKSYAEKLGVEVHTAASCQEAIQALEKRKYLLILMDWRLPEIDGIQCTRTIRDVDAKNGLHTPIIALTARAMEGDREKCLAAGMDDYLSKPFTTAQLKEVVERWIPSRFEG
jgi:CheY-like chemotaxis protein